MMKNRTNHKIRQIFLKLNTLKTFVALKIINKYSNTNQYTEASIPELNNDGYLQRINTADKKGIVR